jgi:uncharacterized damage-inducible protein DinB
MSTTALEDAVEHNVWATIRIIDACAALTAEQLETTVPGTYGSILATLRHTVGADCSYLALLSGASVELPDEETATLPELKAAMERNGPIWVDVARDQGDANRTIVRHRDDGSTSSAPFGVRVAQAIHHGTDHRSQICTALTTLGIEPPEIDVWAMAWEQDRLSETPPTVAAAE